jgi:Ca2+-binding EF-hand superfamily protein
MSRPVFEQLAVAAMVTLATVSTVTSAFAADNTLKMMDNNNDGLISKTEYMKHHERMWAVFKKNKDGLVTFEDMKRAPGATKSDDKTVKAGTTQK